MESTHVSEITPTIDRIGQIKNAARKLLGRHYAWISHILGPSYLRIHWPTRQTYFSYLAKEYAKGKENVVYVGSGSHRISKTIKNLDMFPMEGVDIVGDCVNLPFETGSMDGIISHAMLEHLPNPSLFLRDAHRVLKPGGFIFTAAPFIEGFHSSPGDYYRWTHHGLQEFHEQHGFKMEKLEPLSGPTASLIWVLQEYLAIVFSFNIGFLYNVFFILFGAILLPLKYLDIFFIHYREGYKIGSFYLYVGRKA
jgi:SAM-dependent methyltransferase